MSLTSFISPPAFANPVAFGTTLVLLVGWVARLRCSIYGGNACQPAHLPPALCSSVAMPLSRGSSPPVQGLWKGRVKCNLVPSNPTHFCSMGSAQLCLDLVIVPSSLYGLAATSRNTHKAAISPRPAVRSHPNSKQIEGITDGILSGCDFIQPLEQIMWQQQMQM